MSLTPQDLKKLAPFNPETAPLRMTGHPSPRLQLQPVRSGKPSAPFTTFADRFWEECIQGSGIDAALVAATIRIVSDTEVWPGGDVTYPIHEALNWRLNRFGHQARESLQAAIFLNEDASVWQAKLSRSLEAGKKPYLAPTGNGSRAFLPVVNRETRRAITQRYGCEVPPPGESFWSWLEHHPEIPIVITEGGKKALSLLSQGYVAIALYGVNSGYHTKDALGEPCAPVLISDLARFCHSGRQTILAFDQDAKSETRNKVNIALVRLGGVLEQAGCAVGIAAWAQEQGKGVDDLIVNCGAAAWDTAYAAAWGLAHWQIRQRLTRQLTWEPTLKVSTQDLSTLDATQLPEAGIIGIISEKGTGKTKLTAQMVSGQTPVLAPSHRIALSRNACERLHLDYRGDLDKTPDGQFINAGGYTLRVGFCVDALLAIDPAQFAGCDLVVDEAVQVVRHLLTSATCAQEGKRPALLARFTQLVKVARRVILADADLDNATLHYFRHLRGEETPVCLLQNDFQPHPYPVRLIQTHTFDPVVADLRQDLQELAPGQALFVATDNKKVTQAIARLMATSCPAPRVLVINAETSGGEAEREFISTPDQVLARGAYDLIIASPSLATGVSIEAQGRIAKVYGIFTGVSSSDADILQSLARVREPVERVVWVAQRGRNYAKVSRSTQALTIKMALLEQTSATAAIIRANLGMETLTALQSYDWQADAHLNLYCKIAGDQNFAMAHLRDCVWVRLKLAGHAITVEERAVDPMTQVLYQQAATAQKQLTAEAIVQAAILTYPQVAALTLKESRLPEEEQAIQRYYLCDFYAIAPAALTPEFVLWDADGRRRREVLNLESMLYPETAVNATTRALEKQLQWQQGITPWDISGAALRRELRQVFGLDQFLDPQREWTRADCVETAEIVRQYAQQTKNILHFTPSDKLSEVQIVHQLLSQLGLKVAFRWRGTGTAKHRVYRLESATWQQLNQLLEHRHQRDLDLEQRSAHRGSPLALVDSNGRGDPDIMLGIEPDPGPQNLCKTAAEHLSHWSAAETRAVGVVLRDISPPEVIRELDMS